MTKYPPFLLSLLGIITGLTLGYAIFPYMDFATSVIPGWHTTLFPLNFIPGLILSCLAFFQVLLLLVRLVFKVQEHITTDHIEGLNKLILGASLVVAFIYLLEFANAWYSGYLYEQFAFYQRIFGSYWWAYLGLMFLNPGAPQFFWSRHIRRHTRWTIGICLIINIGVLFQTVGRYGGHRFE